jgi:uncharacterized protein (DUF1697 family)
VNVGGHRTFRPTVLAKQLRAYGVVNIGATGILVVREPGRSRAAFLAELRRKLPVETEIMLCDGRDLLKLETENPFGSKPPSDDAVHFVSILSKTADPLSKLPVNLPAEGEWLVRVIATQGRFAFGLYRRHMKTIGYLRKIDTLLHAPATTRNWNTMLKVLAVLKGC